MSAGCSFRTATADITLPLSDCSITSKSVVTSSAENGNAFSIWIRIISGNSAGSTVGKRNRCASTAVIGNPSTKSSVAASSGTASSKLRSIRTLQAPLRSAERRKFQPCAVGTMKTDADSTSISKLLPNDHLRNIARFTHHHLHSPRNIARFSDAQDTHYLVVESNQGS